MFHNICKNIDTHSSLIFQSILDRFFLIKDYSELELSEFMLLKNNQNMTASDYCKIDPNKSRLIDQLMSKFIKGE